MDNELTEEEIKMENEMKENYINYMAILVASNINTIYKYNKNSEDISFDMIFKTSRDTVELSRLEEKNLFDLTNQILRDKYDLKMINTDSGERIFLNSVSISNSQVNDM